MTDWFAIIKIPGMATLISVVLGFGIAALFRPLCKGPECLIVRGPAVADIRGSVYQYGTRCVEFVAKPVPCPQKGAVDTLTFADAAS